MNAKTTRILKEARCLFWPWCAVIVAGTLPLVEQSRFALIRGGPLSGIHHVIEPLSFLGFVLGIPLLATLLLGNEFQHRTLQLLLSQPIGRMEIWAEKMSVTIVAVLSVALVFCYTGQSALQEDPNLWVIAGTLLISVTASATFWTLVARSTMGGLALNAVNSFIPLALLSRPHWIPQTIAGRLVAAVAFLGYAGVMLWLGRRTLARFQVTGGLAGDDLLIAGPSMMPAALADWFRSRSTSPSLNLIRKEFRLLRPVWLISLLAVPAWICLPVFGLTVERGSPPAVLMVIAFTPLIAVLAGTLSLGEERTSGTHSWHLTLPVSARRQWLIKLLTAMFTALFCAVLLPVLVLIASGSVFGSPSSLVKPDALMLWLPAVALLSFVSFWCACAVKGTVQAALWVFPVVIAFLLTGQFADWPASEMMGFLVSKFDLFADFPFTNSVANAGFFDRALPPLLFVFLLLVPTLLLATVQSYRLFRKQLQNSALFVVRRLLPLALTAFLCNFFLIAYFAFLADARQQMWTVFQETHEAIEKIQPPAADFDAAHPLQLTAEDLFKAAPVSERTRRWLSNSRITVAPDQPHPGGHYCCGRNSRGVTFAPDQTYSWYLATIHLPSGSECTLSFKAGGEMGILGGTCQ